MLNDRAQNDLFLMYVRGAEEIDNNARPALTRVLEIQMGRRRGNTYPDKIQLS